MLFSPRNVLLMTMILVTILSFTNNTDAGNPILDEITAIWDLFETNEEIDQDPNREKQEIMDKFKEVYKGFDEVKEQISGVSDSIDSLGQLGRISSELQPLLNDIYKLISKINVWSKRAQNMIKHFNDYENEELSEFAKDVVLGGDTLTICMERLLDMVTHSRLQGQNLIEVLMKYNEIKMCETKVTTSQLLDAFYHQLLITEAKGLATIQFSFMVLRNQSQRKFTQAMKEVKERSDKRVKELTTTFESVIQSADKTIYKCDPAH